MKRGLTQSNDKVTSGFVVFSLFQFHFPPNFIQPQKLRNLIKFCFFIVGRWQGVPNTLFYKDRTLFTPSFTSFVFYGKRRMLNADRNGVTEQNTQEKNMTLHWAIKDDQYVFMIKQIYRSILCLIRTSISRTIVLTLMNDLFMAQQACFFYFRFNETYAFQ